MQLTLTDAGSMEIDALVDQSADPSPSLDRARGFLADSIAGSPASGPAGVELTRWVGEHLATGGHTTIGTTTVTLGPFGVLTSLHVTASWSD